MICMTIPANALIYGTFLNVSLASFAIFNTASTAFVAVDSMYSRSVVGGTSGIPWVAIVFLCSRVRVDCPCASNRWALFSESSCQLVTGVLICSSLTSCVYSIPIRMTTQNLNNPLQSEGQAAALYSKAMNTERGQDKPDDARFELDYQLSLA